MLDDEVKNTDDYFILKSDRSRQRIINNKKIIFNNPHLWKVLFSKVSFPCSVL